MRRILSLPLKLFLYVKSAGTEAREKKYHKLIIIVVSLIVIILLIGIYQAYFSRKNIYELSNAELQSIEEYVQNVKVEDAVGQILMTGIPGDILNYTNNKHLDYIISELGIGNVFANRYNYYNNDYGAEYSDIYFSKILSFHNHIQSLTRIRKNGLPVLIATDFEGPGLSSIEYGVALPPESLTLSSTQDKKLIRMMGQTIGHQLRSLGIHVLMGPVLDIDSTTQGDTKSAIGARSFGSDIERVFVSSSHYIRGLQEGNIQCFVKHFPGHGAVKGNPHDLTMPTFEGGAKTFKSHLEPYPQFSNYIAGVMTSHVYIKFMDQIESKPVTFSKEFVSNLLRDQGARIIGDVEMKCLGYKDQIIITDDLSDMGSIIKYMKDNKKSFSQIAIEAFDAGHDILLFSHLEVKGQRPRGTYKKFSLSELKDVKEKLVEHISASRTLREQLKNSLRRILRLKAKINKTYQHQNGQFIARDEIIWQDYLKKDITESKSILKNHYRTTTELLNDIFAKSYICITKSKNSDYDINRLPLDSKITFYINKPYINMFEEAFSGTFRNAKFIQVPVNKGKWYNEQKTTMLRELAECDQMYYTLFDIDDRNLLDNLVLKAPREVGKKLIIILHTTPTILTPSMLPIITTIGNFSQHPLSYQSDIDILNGTIKPRDVSRLPINLGINSTFNDITKNKFDIEAAEGFLYIPFFSTDYEQSLWNTLKKQRLLIIGILLLCSLLSGYSFFALRGRTIDKNRTSSIQTMGNKDPLAEEYNLFTSCPMLFVLSLVTVLSIITWFWYILQLDDIRIDIVIDRMSKIIPYIKN